jgi:hypothetical protein
MQAGFTSLVSRSGMANLFCRPVARFISKVISQSDTLPENHIRFSSGDLKEVFSVVRMLQSSSVLSPYVFVCEIVS